MEGLGCRYISKVLVRKCLSMSAYLGGSRLDERRNQASIEGDCCLKREQRERSRSNALIF